MATIQSAIRMYDGVSAPLKNMQNAMTNIINTLEKVQNRMGDAFDSSEIEEARREIEKCGDAFRDVESNANGSVSKQKELNTSIESGSMGMEKLIGKAKGFLGVMGLIIAAKGAFDFAIGSLEYADTQNNAENQLGAVLQNMGVSYQGYQDILKKASEIQGRGIYGDEAMIGGAAEFATYMSDSNAIQSMMGTLSNYAMGMSGGGEVGYSEMVDYATQLGKALNGSYDGLTKKGFSLTEQQKEIIENGTDMQKALVLDEVIGESWDGLYETMSGNGQGSIIQMKNAFGDIREEVGNRVYPVFASFATTLMEHMDTIRNSLMGVADLLVSITALASGAFQGLMNIMESYNQMLHKNSEIGNSTLSLGQLVVSTVWGIWGVIEQIDNNIEIGVKNLVYSLKSVFQGFASYVLGMIADIGNGLNSLPFVNFDTSGLVASANKWSASASESYAKVTQMGSLSDAYYTWRDKGLSFLNGFSSQTSPYTESNWRTGTGTDSSDLASTLAGTSADTAANTAKMADSLSATESELKLLREIAERTAISQFTTASVNVTMTNNNTISSNMDIDGVVSSLEDAISEGIAKTAESAHV